MVGYCRCSEFMDSPVKGSRGGIIFWADEDWEVLIGVGVIESLLIKNYLPIIFNDSHFWISSIGKDLCDDQNKCYRY